MFREPLHIEGFYATRIAVRRHAIGIFIALAVMITTVLLLAGAGTLAVVLAAAWRLAL